MSAPEETLTLDDDIDSAIRHNADSSNNPGKMQQDINVAHAFLRKHSKRLEELRAEQISVESRLNNVEERLMTYYQLFMEVRNDIILVKREQSLLVKMIEQTASTSTKTYDFLKQHAIDELDYQVKSGAKVDKATKAMMYMSAVLVIFILVQSIVFPELHIIEHIKEYISLLGT